MSERTERVAVFLHHEFCQDIDSGCAGGPPRGMFAKRAWYENAEKVLAFVDGLAAQPAADTALAASEGAGLPAGLDAAWAAAEAALPKNRGDWELAVKRIRANLYIATASYAYSLRHYRANIGSARSTPAYSDFGPTPAAALEALTRRLISPASDTEMPR